MQPARAAGGTTIRWATWATLLALGLIAVCGSIVEDSGGTWSAVYLSGSLGAGATVAAFGFVALAGMQFVGRIVGDRLVDRFGQRAVARTGGAITAVGMGLALAFPSIPGTIIGFGAAGFGIATLVPSAMHAADELPGFRAGTGLTLLSWMMRLGFPAGPAGGRADRRRYVIAGCAAAGPGGGAYGRRAVAGAVAAPGTRNHRSAQGFRLVALPRGVKAAWSLAAGRTASRRGWDPAASADADHDLPECASFTNPSEGGGDLVEREDAVDVDLHPPGHTQIGQRLEVSRTLVHREYPD